MTIQNENWIPCAKCGSPTLEIQHVKPEPFSAWHSQSSALATYLGSLAIGAVLAAIVGLIAGSIAIVL